MDIGVHWEFSHSKTKDDKGFIIGQDSRVNKPGGFNIPDPANPGLPASVAGPDQGGTGVALPGPNQSGISFGFINNSTILSATLAALINQSKAKILSAPKVVTINGQMASIEAVQDIRFQTSSVSNGVVTSDFRNVSAGIKLQVTPTVNAEDRITLKINPESSFPTQDSTQAGPIIRTRTASTTVIVKDGDTLVIGGLIDDHDSKGITKVPVLGDIPIIGLFFRSNTSTKLRNELLVFVTPRIVRD
jgi:type II secretory pathway component GspD/PulD (secretin)